MIRSVLAILAGIATLLAVSFGIEAVANPLLMQLFPESFPTPAALSHALPARVFMFAYGSLSVAAGGFVTAWLAGRAPLRHAAAFGIVQTGLTLLAMITLWHLQPAMAWIATLIMTLPAALLGGWLFTRYASGRVSKSTASTLSNSM